MSEIDRFMVGDLGIWGKIVKSWATRTDYVGDGTSKDYLQYPRDIDELKRQLGKAGVGVILPDRYKKVTVVQSTEDTLVIAIPEERPLLEAESKLKEPNAAGYAAPDFYKDKFKAKDRDAAEPVDQKLLVHAMSIGEYTIRNCR
jgi:hypothetical protein